MILVFTRELVIPKDRWREPGCVRTLAALDVEPLIRNASREGHQGLVSIGLQPHRAPVVQDRKGNQKIRAAVFDFTFLEDGDATVTLREEGCFGQLGQPRRATRPVGTLRPWKVLRILLNGRRADYSGQTYIVRDYHLAKCDGPEPERFEAVRLLDLQEDLA